jgi:uncharacterized protein Yka (UPF0111/DUF47 family)
LVEQLTSSIQSAKRIQNQITNLLNKAPKNLRDENAIDDEIRQYEKEKDQINSDISNLNQELIRTQFTEKNFKLILKQS